MADYRRKIMSLAEAIGQRELLTQSGQKLVFTNGCFDLLHPGHTRYLADARALGDFLLVGLNTDSSVRGLKGNLGRPICPEGVRAEMLAALGMVDGVVLFNEETPLKLIQALSPDFLVKGGDYQDPTKIVGATWVTERGGSVLSLPLAEGFSSTALIERIGENLF